MQKVLIISYFFPPCNLTGGQRPYYWGKYLHKYGYKPIVVTRNWDIPISEARDTSRPTGTRTEHKDYGDYEVYYVPFVGNKKDKIYAKYGNKRAMWRKIWTFYELIMQNFTVKAMPFSNMYWQCKHILKADKSIRKVIVTANPFSIFQFGYQLKKTFPYINWIADYRDDWSTSELVKKRSFLSKVLFHLEARSERKWLSNASYIASVSPYYVQKIGQFVSRKGFTLLNGYAEDKLSLSEIILPNYAYIITYNGSLYASQKIEPFLKAFKKIIDKYKTKIKIKLQFPGLAFDPVQAGRVQSALKGYEPYLWISDRISQEKVLEMQQASHLLLMCSHEGLRGIPSSKLYEYIGLRKKILLCPTDNDILQDTLEDTGLGIICKNDTEAYEKLEEEIQRYIAVKGKLKYVYNEERIKSYTREAQVEVLAKYLDKI